MSYSILGRGVTSLGQQCPICHTVFWAVVSHHWASSALYFIGPLCLQHQGTTVLPSKYQELLTRWQGVTTHRTWTFSSTAVRTTYLKHHIILLSKQAYTNSYLLPLTLLYCILLPWSVLVKNSSADIDKYESLEEYTRWFKYDRDWFVCKQAALRSSCATLREWSHNLHPPSCSG